MTTHKEPDAGLKGAERDEATRRREEIKARQLNKGPDRPAVVRAGRASRRAARATTSNGPSSSTKACSSSR